MSSLQVDDLSAWIDIPPHQSLDLLECLDPKASVGTFWKNNTRPDGRLFHQARSTEVVRSILKHSVGSALVKQGNTKILAAMTLQFGQPAPERPDHGEVWVTVSTSDHKHDDILQSWLQRMLDDLLPSKLTLIIGRVCIRLVVTVMILQDDGNLADAALLACMSAWKDTTLPTMDDLVESQGRLWWKHVPQFDQMKNDNSTITGRDYRISLSLGIIRNGNENENDDDKDNDSSNIKFLVDPTGIEESVIDGNLTIIVDMSDRTIQLEYSSGIPLSMTDLALVSKMANGRADELSKLF